MLLAAGQGYNRRTAMTVLTCTHNVHIAEYSGAPAVLVFKIINIQLFSLLVALGMILGSILSFHLDSNWEDSGLDMVFL